MNLFENLQKMQEYSDNKYPGKQMKKFKFKCRKCGKEFIDEYDYPLPIDCGAAVQCPDCLNVASIMSNEPIEESINDEENSGLKVCRHCLDAIISREGKQNIINTYEYDSFDEDAEPLICEWCEDEVDELYEINNAPEL